MVVFKNDVKIYTQVLLSIYIQLFSENLLYILFGSFVQQKTTIPPTVLEGLIGWEKYIKEQLNNTSKKSPFAQ